MKLTPHSLGRLACYKRGVFYAYLAKWPQERFHTTPKRDVTISYSEPILDELFLF